MTLPVKLQLQAFTNLADKAIRQAASRALNKAATATRREISRVLKQEEQVNLPPKLLRDAVTITKAKTEETLSAMSVTLTVSKKTIRLYYFGARARKVRTQRGKRVGVTVKVKGQRKSIEGAFLAPFGAGKVGVFVRKGDARLPIKQLSGPTIGSLLNEAAQRRVLAFGRAAFEREYAAELSKRIAKAKGAA